MKLVACCRRNGMKALKIESIAHYFLRVQSSLVYSMYVIMQFIPHCLQWIKIAKIWKAGPSFLVVMPSVWILAM